MRIQKKPKKSAAGIRDVKYHIINAQINKKTIFIKIFYLMTLICQAESK